MEAIGRLTGGIAHDFNNQLTAIIGFSELIQHRMPLDNPHREMVDSIHNCGQHAANLVRQLLAFSRRQIIEPKVLDLNHVVAKMDKMLQRIIGEDTVLKTSLASDLWPVKTDPTQFEQVIVNLAVNARDAMPEGGELTIETANAVLDETQVAGHYELPAGEYVLLAVSDTGVGMSEEIKTHIFEPFFTTKERGQGTGLGLATVYGIVRQSGGDIWVYSEAGLGTTFKVYLPRTQEGDLPGVGMRYEAGMPGGSETILLVEDDERVRQLVGQVLIDLGYELLDAGDGQVALQVSAEYSATIDLLLTDVIMPDMNGKVLAEALQRSRAGLKVLFMSGYADEAIARHGVLDPGVAFIQKPLSLVKLARKVRGVLDG
jgi:CheY-like chemotaxis protein